MKAHVIILAALAVLTGCASTPEGPKGPTLAEQYKIEQDKINAIALTHVIQPNEPLVTDRLCPQGRKGCNIAALNAELARTYTYMDFQSYLTYCRDKPQACKDLRANENGLRADHDKGVEMKRVALQQELDRRYQAEIAAHNERVHQQGQMLMQNAQMQNQLYQQSLQQQPSAQQPGRIDQACVARCTAAGSMLQFCQTKCSY